MSQVAEQPDVTFYQLFPGTPPPRRADPLLFGGTPSKAEHYCEPFTAASAFGWYLFPPMEFSLLWDGRGVFWQPAGHTEWIPFEGAPIPGFAEDVTRLSPFPIEAGGNIPFLIAPGELPGIVQIWTGLLVRPRC